MIAPLAYPTRPSPVVYLGRSGNLRRRLRAHLRNHEKFGSEIGEGRFIFRFAAVPPTRLREAEAELGEVFCEARFRVRILLISRVRQFE